MINKILLLLFFFLFPVKIHSQWYAQNLNASGYFGGFYFANQNVGWLFSNNPSRIYKTTNSGTEWNIQFLTDGPFSGRFFLDENHGWFGDLDSYGTRLFYTSDGGQNWNLRFNTININFYNFHFFDSMNGIAIGSIGAPASMALFRTSDGGINWDINNVYDHLSSLFFLDSLNGWCAGDTLFKTTNGGLNWTKIAPLPDFHTRKIYFSDELNGWIICNNKLYSTSNSGLSWNMRINNISTFYFVDSLKGWYIVNDKIYHTNDGGNNWHLQYSNPGYDLLDIYFIDEEFGWASGHDGFILHTINGGTPVELVSFTLLLENSNVQLSWITASEINNQGFQIERASFRNNETTPLQEWINIGFVEGKGTTTEINNYTFTDENLSNGKYKYRLKQIDFDGTFEHSKEIEVEINSPEVFYLHQNYPNPFNPVTKIKFTIPNVVD